MRGRTIDLYENILQQVEAAGSYLTIRHLFYRLVSIGVIPKTEQGYHQVIYHTTIMRKNGILPYSVFADNTRLRRKRTTYNNLSDALNFWANNYRRELWATQDSYIEIWSEKDAITNIVYESMYDYDVPFMVARGFSSLTFLWGAAETIKEYNAEGKYAYIYHLGDHDPSGVKASQDIEIKLREFGCEFEFKKLAVTPEQIYKYNLPTRPTKKSNHSGGFVGESVEIDAMDPAVLKEIVRSHIERHINWDQLANVRNAEALEKETLRRVQLRMQ